MKFLITFVLVAVAASALAVEDAVNPDAVENVVRDKRAVYVSPYSAGYAAYAPYAYAPGYASPYAYSAGLSSPYVASPYVASPYVASPYSAYPSYAYVG